MRHRRNAVVLTIVALFATSACGQGDVADDRAIDAPMPAEPGGPIPVEPDGGIGDGAGPAQGDPDPQTARKVEPHAGETVDVRARPWERVVPNEDQTELTVFWSSGVAPCTVLDRVDVDETDDAVTITVYEGTAAESQGQMCIEIAEYKAYTVELDGELGPRSILDGAA